MVANLAGHFKSVNANKRCFAENLEPALYSFPFGKHVLIPAVEERLGS